MPKAGDKKNAEGDPARQMELKLTRSLTAARNTWSRCGPVCSADEVVWGDLFDH